MHINIANKILSISAVVLVMMILAAIYSIFLTKNISSDLHGIASKHLPASLAVSRVSNHILEQGILLQRMLLSIEERESIRVVQRELNSFREFSEKIKTEFNLARKLLNEEARNTRVRQRDHQLLQQLESITALHSQFELFGKELISILESGNHDAFKQKDRDFNEMQNQLDDQITQLGFEVAKLADKAVEHADKDERQLLLMSILLTGLTALLAVLFSTYVTKVLVRSVHNLVSGAEKVESGELDIKVEVTSNDEIGKLTVAFNQMVDGLRLKERIHETFGKYMDPRIVANLLDQPETNRKTSVQHFNVSTCFQVV